ncbi:head-tail connector protein [Asticcacaulis endophyticus]|uniref:Phage gp6-like head-tail connector protein n=1 Tax=Asticcacaulis endophyticus TaxID=1395890 RepID=A0A918UZP2_9CAUL|nr:head-tail connector protein [Asticcacaulis endophyticus]GGZ45539.1 phage gp6-like head-tail connector protein [Asticcacaulis endophyticus]
MSDPVSLIEAKLFLRVSHDEEDALIATLIAAASARLNAALGLVLDEASPAPLRLAVLNLVAEGYQSRGEMTLDSVEPWISPYRQVRL